MRIKKLSLIMLVSLLILIVISLGQAKKITLTFMTPLGGADGAYMDKIIANFNKEHPDIEVVHLVLVNSLEYKTKLSTGIATKQAPQVLFIRKPDMPLFIEQDQFKTFTEKELKQYGIDIKDVYPELLKGIVNGDKIYGIPLDCWIFYMAYNRGNFAKAGLDPDKPPRTRAEFEKAMEALKKVTPKGVTPYYENPTWSWLWVHLMWQFGGDLLTPDFKKPAFQEAGAKALRLLMSFQDKGYLPKSSVDPGPAFESGQSSVLITGVWTSTAWKGVLKENFGAAPAPLFGTHRAVFGGSHVLALPKVMVEDPQVLKAAMTWVKYLWDHAIEWYAAGQTPARKSIATSKELKDKLPYIYTIAQQLPYVKTFQMFPYISEIVDTIATYLEDVLITRKLTPEKAMEMAAEEVMPIIEDYWAGKK
ncbi:extracellular solute-binding protein [Dictyoglomus thermophilum]|uniref:Bacterial extracellular solute-binding protein, putative n=1 Tax=Dictyoglomus thermophilum (strain ATCC 35947 / DSM 3960 / H-6-12) TaxID=309799 RepID=B5YAH3_DICT6|nr:extracellular solute-binding protein [Dictyoglomus thermophilum]ACI18733.1 bacterial extracellular solute-binding protein, putative [Dictyoglomus thermophilum H-6-12]MCX7720497.1 extracellular solute-binding protein [Dictyoglomus thermophilum]